MHRILRLTLFERIVLANAVVVATAAALLAATPFSVSYPPRRVTSGCWPLP